jgi:hypothetical protein
MPVWPGEHKVTRSKCRALLEDTRARQGERNVWKKRVDISNSPDYLDDSGNNSVVECNLAKVEVAGSNPVSRSRFLAPPEPSV